MYITNEFAMIFKAAVGDQVRDRINVFNAAANLGVDDTAVHLSIDDIKEKTSLTHADRDYVRGAIEWAMQQLSPDRDVFICIPRPARQCEPRHCWLCADGPGAGGWRTQKVRFGNMNL